MIQLQSSVAMDCTSSSFFDVQGFAQVESNEAHLQKIEQPRLAFRHVQFPFDISSMSLVNAFSVGRLSFSIGVALRIFCEPVNDFLHFSWYLTSAACKSLIARLSFSRTRTSSAHASPRLSQISSNIFLYCCLPILSLADVLHKYASSQRSGCFDLFFNLTRFSTKYAMFLPNKRLGSTGATCLLDRAFV